MRLHILSKIKLTIQVVEYIETFDHIGRTTVATTSTVTDTTEHPNILDDQLASAAANPNPESSVPPVLTKTWFHTVLWLGDGCLSRLFEKEYWHEPNGFADGEYQRMQLSDTQLPHLRCYQTVPLCRAQ